MPVLDTTPMAQHAPVSPAKHSRSLDADRSETAWHALTTEPEILETVLSFVPVPPNSSAALVLLRTISQLCRAVPRLHEYVGPRNQAFWREKVLSHFDFSVDADRAFNVDDDGDIIDVCRDDIRWHEDDDQDDDREMESGLEDETSEKDAAKWKFFKAVRSYIKKWEAANPKRREPTKYLESSLAYWSELGVHFRMKEYGFLRRIQNDKSLIATKWPAHENAFTLFSDLTVLQQLAKEDGTYQTWSDGDQWVYPCLLGRFDDEIVLPGYDFVQFCGIYPHFWLRRTPVSKKWSGFDGPRPEVEKDPNVDCKDSMWRYQDGALTQEERYNFPHCATRRIFLELRRLVYENCTDWRRIFVHTSEYPGPEFYIGKSKASQRWLGFVGQSDYACATSNTDAEY